MSFLMHANRVKVSPQLLGEAMKVHAVLAPEDRKSFEARTISIIQMLERKGIYGRRRSDILLAIEFRLTALARLLESNDVQGWRMRGDDGAEFIHDDLIRAASEELLIEDSDQQAAFEPVSFRARVLMLAKPEGKA